MTRFLVQSRVFLGNQHAMWSKQHNGKVNPRQLWRDLSHLSAHSRYTTIGDAGEGCVLEVSPLQLGRVDELFDANPHGNEMDQSQKGLAQFLIPRGDTSKLFEIVEEPFYLLTELVEVFIIV
jgi:hypothetical protein